MADYTVKRIIDEVEENTPASGDYLIIDNAATGSKRLSVANLLLSQIGDMGNLLTEDKSSIVGAINELTSSHCGGGSTSILIAASNSTESIKEKADYVCTGVNDQLTINNILSSLTNGEICLLAGDYYISGSINPVDNVDIKGFGNPQLHLTDRVVTTLSRAASVNDEVIYLADPSKFVVGQKITLTDGTKYDAEVGLIKTIDYETGAVTMYSRGLANYNPETSVGKVSIAMPQGATVFTDSCVIMGWDKHNVTISGLHIDGNSANLGGFNSDTDFGANLIEWSGGGNVRILNNKLTNCYKHSVLFVYGTTNSFVCENVVNSAGVHGIDFYTNVENNLVFGNILTDANIQCHGGLKTVIACNQLIDCSIFMTGGVHNLVIGNKVDYNKTIGRCLSLSGKGGLGNEIVGNIFAGGMYGIQVDSHTNTTIASNKFANQRSIAIDLYSAKSCTVEGNNVYLPNSVTPEGAIVIQSASEGNVVVGNSITGTPSKTTVGITEKGTTADRNVVANNVIYDATSGVSITGSSSVEQNNIFVASA